jgi:hypothetical protein
MLTTETVWSVAELGFPILSQSLLGFRFLSANFKKKRKFARFCKKEPKLQQFSAFHTPLGGLGLTQVDKDFRPVLLACAMLACPEPFKSQNGRNREMKHKHKPALTGARAKLSLMRS